MTEDAADTGQRRDRPGICFVAPNMYAMVSQREDLGHIGGAETQLWLIVRELVARGYRASVVVWDHGQPDAIEHNGIKAFKMCRMDAGWPGVRLLYPRATSMWGAMGRANADVYVQRTADSDTGMVAAWCRLHRRRSLFCVASDTDCRHDLPRLATRRERLLFRQGLSRVDGIVCQTHNQQRMVAEQFGLESRLIRSCGLDPLPERAERAEVTPGVHPRVLWVGRFAANKRLELFLDVACLCPELTFDVVGEAEGSTPYARDLATRSRRIPNVLIHGRIPYQQMGSCYDCAAVLVCTSRWEGFPNTFVEAWSRGVPTVSTVDPDNLIADRDLGGVAGDAPGLAAALRGVLARPARYCLVSGNCRRYFLRAHTVEAAVARYEQTFRELSSPGRSRAQATSQRRP